MRIGLPKSVFGRAFVVIVLSGLVTQGIMLCIVMGVGPNQPGPRGLLEANIGHYLRLLARDLVETGDADRIAKMLEGTGFSARASGAQSWQVGGNFPDPSEITTVPGILPLAIGVFRGRPVFEFKVPSPRGETLVTLMGPVGPMEAHPPVVAAIILGLFLTVFAVASFAVRRILKPLSALSSAFDEVKRGKMDIAVTPKGDDELSRLSRSFNEMAESIQFLIRDKEQLFLELSHEFRAPIARASAANALVEETELRESIQRDLKELDGLIHAQLTAARLEAGSPVAGVETVEVSQLLEEVVGLFPEAEKRIELAAAPDPVLCDADPRSLMMLFRNLIENALKYSPRDKSVHVTTGNQGNQVFVTVRDEGSGIAPQEQARIQTPFYRGSDPKKLGQPGFGLGLALCHRVLHAHHGMLRIDSAPGRGTSITALLPASTSDAEHPQPPWKAAIAS